MTGISSDVEGPGAFGRFVRAKRLALGLGQKELAELAGVRSNHLNKIERERIDYVSPSVMHDLAHALNKSAAKEADENGQQIKGLPIPLEELRRFDRPPRTTS